MYYPPVVKTRDQASWVYCRTLRIWGWSMSVGAWGLLCILFARSTHTPMSSNVGEYLLNNDTLWYGGVEGLSDEGWCRPFKQMSHISTHFLFERNQTVYEILVFLAADTWGRALHRSCQTIQTGQLRRRHMLATNGTLAHSYYHQNQLFYWNMYDFMISKCYL